MATFINTVDVLGDAVVTDRIIDRSIDEYKDDIVTKIGKNAFAYCSLLTNVDFPAVTNIDAQAFYYCYSLTSVILRSETMCTLGYASSFYGCYHITGVKDSVYNPNGDKDGYIYVPGRLLNDYKSAANWSTYADQIKALDEYIELDIGRKYVAFGTTTHISISLAGYDSVPTVQVTSTDSNIVAVENVTVSLEAFEFDLVAQNTEATIEVSMTVTGKETFSGSFNVSVLETIPEASYTVELIDGVTYGFELNDAGYYESMNKGIDSSFSLCKVTFVNPLGLDVQFKCINHAENDYDYGLLSNVNTTLTATNTADSSGVFKNFKGQSMTSAQTIRYGGITEGFVYVKFVKDMGASTGNDSLQFKVEFV